MALLATATLGWSEAVPGRARGEVWARWNAAHDDEYELDGVERWITNGALPTCDHVATVSYRGTSLRYASPVLVSPPFRERLERFEKVAERVAREVYGRAPVRVRHLGAFNCRRTRSEALLSEHALGNAIDIAGFDFGPASPAQVRPEGVPWELGQAFEVRVSKHWSASNGVEKIHARFLKKLGERLRKRPDIFRSMLGPGHGGHAEHLHLDVSPWRYVDL